MVWETNEFRLSLAEGKDRRLLAQGKPENPRGKTRFPLEIIPWLSPDALHPGWRLFSRRARSITASSNIR
jgi:hypothetical protein